MMYRFFSVMDPSQKEVASCVRAYVLETIAALTSLEETEVRWFLRTAWDPTNLKMQPRKTPDFYVGPRPAFATSHSTNMVSAFHGIGIEKILQIETFIGYTLNKKVSQKEFFKKYHDRMTEQIFLKLPQTYQTVITPDPVRTIPLLEKGIRALEVENKKLGLAMDGPDMELVHQIFKNLKRNPTDVELFAIAQGNSEHCRHHRLRGHVMIDGKWMPHSIFDLIKAPWLANPGNSIIAFNDNSSAIRGGVVEYLVPKDPTRPSPMKRKAMRLHPIFTAETHNFPTGKAPYPGAATGAGGRIRDILATGRGAITLSGGVMYAFSSLNFPDYVISGELRGAPYPSDVASALQICVQGSHGVVGYGNPYGEPLINGATRMFDMILASGERQGYIKPILFTSGLGVMRQSQKKKLSPKKGMKVVMIGGPGFRIGVGGGSASSVAQGENKEVLDFNAVQRGDPQMEQKVFRVIQACFFMGAKTPIYSIHDQGAGGPANVLTELVNPAGATIEIRNIRLGDRLLSVLEIWSAEYQERLGLLIDPKRIDVFLAICKREQCPCEVLGDVTGNGNITVTDAALKKAKAPVDLPLRDILGDVPRKTYEDVRIKRHLEPFTIPSTLSVAELLKMVFSLPSVGSKRFLTEKGDRAVGGLVRMQPHVGQFQLPIANAGVTAFSLFSPQGAVTAIGEQPIVMLVNDAAGMRMAMAEMLKNMGCCYIPLGLAGISCSGNEMIAVKLEGEFARLYDALLAAKDFMIPLNQKFDGGKDSMSMSTKVGKDTVKSPFTLVVSGYAHMEDATQFVTPDLKYPGESNLLVIDDSPGKNRLGGSAAAQACGVIGNEAPDIENLDAFKRGWEVIQQLIRDGLIKSYHDTLGDGGLITALCEMAMASGCGFHINIAEMEGNAKDILFTQESRVIVEYLPKDEKAIHEALAAAGVSSHFIGFTTKEPVVHILHMADVLLNEYTSTVRQWWEATSNRINQEQRTVKYVESHVEVMKNMRDKISYNVSVLPQASRVGPLRHEQPKAVVIREAGTNSDAEFIAALTMAGFDVQNIPMSDLLAGDASLKDFQFLGIPGGFSYADDFGSGRAWAGKIKWNPKLRKMFDEFFARPDTLSLGICNGAQMMMELGLFSYEMPSERAPRLVQNKSKLFESRWSMVKIPTNNSVLLGNMHSMVLGVHVDHGEGQFFCPHESPFNLLLVGGCVPLYYVNEQHHKTEEYPFNPNGSPLGIAGLTTENGRHMALMPHPERSFLLSQWHYVPEEWKNKGEVSPWFQMFQNAHEWCYNHR